MQPSLFIAACFSITWSLEIFGPFPRMGALLGRSSCRSRTFD